MSASKAENESSKSSVGKIIGIVLAIVLLAGGGYLVYRFWPRKSAEQIQQEQEKKDELRRQIKLIEEKITQAKKALVEKKAGRQYEYKTFDEHFFKEVVFDNPDQEAKELLKKKTDLWNNEYVRLSNEINDLILQQNQEIQAANDKNLADWNKQKDGNWKTLTESLSKGPVIKAKFDQLITTFYYRYKEKKNIPTHPAVNLKGFSHFYVDKEGGRITEMGSTAIVEEEAKVQTVPTMKIKNYPLEIRLNQLYLLSNGRNPGGRMDKFFYEEPGAGKPCLEISFDKLIQTIAHEIAHALQSAKNASEDKLFINAEGIVDHREPLSDCWESGKGERDQDYNLIKPDYPELVKEHKQFEEEIEQMIKSDTQIFSNFKAWWEATA